MGLDFPGDGLGGAGRDGGGVGFRGRIKLS